MKIPASMAKLDLGDLRLNGTDARKTHASLIEAMTSLSMTETITGASSLTMEVNDADRALLRSGRLSQRSTLTLAGTAFELAGTKKTGSSLSIVFEDLAVAKLRRATSFRKVGPGQMSRAAFVSSLVRKDAPWVKIRTTRGPSAKVELSRGTAKSRGDSAQPEDTWAAAQRIMGEIQWRVWAYRGTLNVLPDKWLREQTPYVLSEDSPGVDDIDLDYDVGKPTATASITGRAGFSTLAPGSAVKLTGMGPGNRVWLVESITRTYGTDQVGAQLILPLPTLPEPEEVAQAAGATGGEVGEDGWDPTHLADDQDLDTGGLTADDDVEMFVRIALAQRGKPYVWGASGPGSFDCSGLVQYCAARAGFRGISKPVSNLYKQCQDRGKIISIGEATRTRGAVLIRVGVGQTNHIAISLGNGKTMEAMGRAYGCKIGNIKGRFTHGGLLPGMFGASKSKTTKPRVIVRPDDGNIPLSG